MCTSVAEAPCLLASAESASSSRGRRGSALGSAPAAGWLALARGRTGKNAGATEPGHHCRRIAAAGVDHAVLRRIRDELAEGLVDADSAGTAAPQGPDRCDNPPRDRPAKTSIEDADRDAIAMVVLSDDSWDEIDHKS